MVIFYYASVVVLSKEIATRRKIFQQGFASAHINTINKCILAFRREFSKPNLQIPLQNNFTENRIDLSQEARTWDLRRLTWTLPMNAEFVEGTRLQSEKRNINARSASAITGILPAAWKRSHH